MDKLQKRYGLLTAICMVVGIVIGSGVFFKAQTILQKTGGKVYLQGVLQGYKPSNKRALTERCYSLSQMKVTRRGILLHP